MSLSDQEDRLSDHGQVPGVSLTVMMWCLGKNSFSMSATQPLKCDKYLGVTNI